VNSWNISKAQRAHKIVESAEELLLREGKKAQKEGILRPRDVVMMMAIASTQAILKFSDSNGPVAQTMAAEVVHTIITNLDLNGVDVSEIELR
jgi:hypothetical protein